MLGLALILPFFGGPVGRAASWLLLAWIAWQDIRDILLADEPGKLSAVADLLLNIGLVLLSRGRVAARVVGQAGADALVEIAEGADVEASMDLNWDEAPEQLLEGGQTSREAEPVEQLPDVQGASGLVRSDPLLEQPWSGIYNRLSVIRQAELALYKVRPVPSARRLHAGVHRGLYSAGGDLYTSLDGDWFKVEDHEGVVRLVSDSIDSHQGPQLISRGSGEWGFAPDLAPSDDLPRELALEQQRLAQLDSDAQRRKDLDIEYEKMSAMFATQTFTDDTTLQGISRGFAEDGSEEVIENELYKADVTHWCAVTLLDVLSRRRRVMSVQDYSLLHGKLFASAVQARRNQVVLYGGKRNLWLKQNQLAPSIFDAPQLGQVVFDQAAWRQTAGYLPDYSSLQAKAVEASQEAEQRFEQMKHEAHAVSLSVSALDTSAWAGRRMSLKWQELQLRTLAMLCFDPEKTVYRDATFELVQEVTTLCSLKLMTRRELFVAGRFNWDQRLRVMNDGLDALVMADSRLSYHLAPMPGYFNTRAVGEYRRAVRSLFNTLEADLLQAYKEYETADLQAVYGVLDSHPKRLVDDTMAGLVIGNHRKVVEAGESQEYLDVLEPFDHRGVWSFKRYGTEDDEVWREVIAPAPALSADLLPHEYLARVGGEATRLWRDAQLQFERTMSLETIRRMSPRRVRSEWLNHANKMNRQRDLLVEALKVPVASEAHQALLDFFKNTPTELYDEILRFLEQGTLARHRMILRGYPTNDGLLTLYNTWKIHVVEIPAKGALIRQFEVRESSTGRPLWFARFHYDNPASREQGYNFVRGNLKRYIDRDISYAKLKQRATTNELKVHVLRTNIDHEVARAVFFTETAAPLVQ
ncbi:MAG: hypothetical protein GAK37_03553 [Pseudomonas sp.]|nr:MAG: hypothetical protein GAK37_03553 [Pseudomonas sp.]